ncbi:MAG: MotA/TolQ/ExbB proton channel family protein [Polyangiaceae bacterium]|nr:MotA/TolQ/ExbB proton channel family protein [Polyangiaceae bacterium]
MTERLLRVALLGSAWVLYVLMALSVLSISIIVERWLYFRRLRDDVGRLRAEVVNAFLEGDDERVNRLLDASPSLEARIVAVGLRFKAGGASAITDAMEAELERRKKELERGSNVLGTLGNNAPFIGLFGTVLGVIEAFHHLGDTSNKAAMGNVMAAIAEALVATGVGLFVAIPAVVAYNVVQERVTLLEASVVSFRKFLTASLHLLNASRTSNAPREERAEEPADDPEAHVELTSSQREAFANGHAVTREA